MRMWVLMALWFVAGPVAAQMRELGKFSLAKSPGTAMAIDPAVKYAIIAFTDGSLCCFPTDQKIVTLYGYIAHKKSITGVHFLNDGKHFVTVSNDGTLKSWPILAAREHHKAMEDKNGEGKPPTPMPVYTVNAHLGSISVVSALSADAKLIATGSGEGIVRLWDAATGKAAGSLDVAHRGGVKGLAFHPEGKWLATAGADKTVKLWELGAKPKVIKTFADHEGTVNAVHVSPDGQFVAAGTGVPKKSGVVKVWNVATAKVEATLEGHEDVVTTVLFHPKNAYLASGDATGKIRVWDVKEKKMLYMDEHAESIRGLIIASDASRFGSISGPVAHWWRGFGKMP